MLLLFFRLWLKPPWGAPKLSLCKMKKEKYLMLLLQFRKHFLLNKDWISMEKVSDYKNNSFHGHMAGQVVGSYEK